MKHEKKQDSRYAYAILFWGLFVDVVLQDLCPDVVVTCNQFLIFSSFSIKSLSGYQNIYYCSFNEV